MRTPSLTGRDPVQQSQPQTRDAKARPALKGRVHSFLPVPTRTLVLLDAAHSIAVLTPDT